MTLIFATNNRDSQQHSVGICAGISAYWVKQCLLRNQGHTDGQINHLKLDWSDPGRGSEGWADSDQGRAERLYHELHNASLVRLRQVGLVLSYQYVIRNALWGTAFSLLNRAFPRPGVAEFDATGRSVIQVMRDLEALRMEEPCELGLFYMTFKKPFPNGVDGRHAMAAFVGEEYLWFLDPNEGLHRWTGTDRTTKPAELMSRLYGRAEEPFTEFILYRVAGLMDAVSEERIHDVLPREPGT